MNAVSLIKEILNNRITAYRNTTDWNWFWAISSLRFYLLMSIKRFFSVKRIIQDEILKRIGVKISVVAV